MFKILKNANVTKATGTDQVSRKFLKDGARTFAKPMNELCNLLMTLGSFPDACKIAKIKPLFSPIQDWQFRCCSRMGVGQKDPPPLPKICHTYPTMMKRYCTVITYLRKIQKIYESRDIPPEVC